MVLGPKGEVLFEGGNGEEAGYVVIDTDEVTRTRQFLTVFKDRVPEVYKKLV